MTLQSLDRAIAKARGEFQRLNARHYYTVLKPTLLKGRVRVQKYRALEPAMEARIIALAERVVRLVRFRSMLATKAYANGLDTSCQQMLTVAHDD